MTKTPGCYMRVKIFFSALFLLMLSSVLTYAQTSPGGPCAFTDPDNSCPLDTWVIVLAFVAVLFAALHLSRKQKSPLRNSEGIQ
jgi:hypothetical protein